MKLFCTVVFAGLICFSGVAGQCLSTGRFRNDAEPNCRGYTMCLQGGAGFIEYNLKCPDTFVFNPLDNVCSNHTTFRCTDLKDPFNCTEIGVFENPLSMDCTSYVACIKGLGNIIFPNLFDCPLETVFSPEQHACVNITDYECIDIVKEQNKEVYSCTAAGNFAYDSSENCSSFVSCEFSGNLWKSSFHECPPLTVFNPHKGSCVVGIEYDCKKNNGVHLNPSYVLTVLALYLAF